MRFFGEFILVLFIMVIAALGYNLVTQMAGCVSVIETAIKQMDDLNKQN